MRTVEIGSEAITAQLSVKYNSRNKFSLFFWDDVANTIPSSLAGAAITIEIDVTASPTIWTSVINVNEAVFDITPANSLFTWDARKFRVVLTKTAVREVVITGEVRVQR